MSTTASIGIQARLVVHCARRLRRALQWLGILLMAAVVSACSDGGNSVNIEQQAIRLTTERSTVPLDVDVPEPGLSWQLPGVERQYAYQIAVASDAALIADEQADVWDSGQVVSAVQTDVPYQGPELASNATYFWAVRIWVADDGSPGPWSEPARFETGLFSAADWSATWLGRDNPPATPALGEQAPAPLLRKAFTLDGSIARARLRIVGLGHYVAYINGRRVGSQVLDPPPTAFDVTALYATHDVTDLLQAGENAIGVVLGRGYFSAPAGSASLSGFDLFQLGGATWHSEPRLLAQLDVTYDNGTTARIVSDGSWAMADAPMIDAAWEGEHYDARLEQPGWSDTGFDDAGWTPAPEQAAPTRKTLAMAMEPIQVAETLPAVSSGAPAPGVTVYDFGRTIAGWAQITVTGTAGTTITLTYGETLNQDGTVATLSDLVHVDSYTLSGRGQEQWEPSFARHGFRFVQVSVAPSEPVSISVQARVNHTAVASTGTFDSDNALLNTLQRHQRASLLANLWGFPTDTPWRDRMGWTADAWLFLDSAAFNFDVQRLFRQWLRTYRESQAPDGSLPVVAPVGAIVPPFANDPSWSGTLVLIVWGVYQHYGDERILSENYDAMVRWMNLMETTIAGSGNLHRGFSFGDWAAPGSEANGATALVPPEGSALTASADLYQEARTLARIAAVLGHPEDTARFDALADKIKTAFNARYFDTTANVYRTGNGTEYRQTSNLMPLAYGLVPADHEEAVYANLVADIRARGDHLNTGAIGTKQLLPVLTERGDTELAYTLATQTTYPSWGYWVDRGATSSWETWSHTGPMQSQNHAFLGTFDDWLYKYLAGINATEPGYTAVRIKPFIPVELMRASASIHTPRGTIKSQWQRGDGVIELTVTIPGNTSAEVHVPASTVDVVSITGGSGAELLRREDDHAIYRTKAGEHSFKVQLGD
jgi:alpha-L-rhamnosidase